jgi:hypothetical protein
MSSFVAPLTDSRQKLGRSRIRPISLLLFALYTASAIAFIVRVNHPVFDEEYHLPEVRRYATQPVNVQSLREHGVPTGPGSFLWMSIGGRIFGDKLWAYRSMILLSWLFLGAALVALARRPGQIDIAYFSLLTILIFPHAPTTFPMVLTEGPALLFAMAGVLVWATTMWREETNTWNIFFSHFGALLIGLAVISRQYYLALLPAMACLLAIRVFKASPIFQARSLWRISTLITAMLPVVWLLFVWGGLSSPGMAAGTSFPGWVARPGLNPERPLIAAFYICSYSVLVFWPYLLEGNVKAKLAWFLGGALTTWLIIRAGVQVDQLGPLKAALDRVPGGGISKTVVESILVGTGAAALVQLVSALQRRRDALMSNPVVLLSILVVPFFVAEQLGVGGNIPFYERYLLQIAPFLGVIRGFTMPHIGVPDIAIWVAMTGVGQLMLWRYS